MNSGAPVRSTADLELENAELREEVRVARRASDLTAQLVAEQFARIEEILLKLEEKARAEEELGHELADKLHEAEAREAELAAERQRLEKMQVAAINMMEDITAARTAAEAATKAKSEFLANMSHEIRTPMTAILGFANVIRDDVSCCAVCPKHTDCQTRDKNLENVETIRRNGEHLLQIINDILDISKIEAGRLEVEAIRCSPVALVADIQSLMQVRADARGLAFVIEYAGKVPETIQSDPIRLKQILVNVIGNAIKFTEKGSVRLVTRLLTAEDAQQENRCGGHSGTVADGRAAAPRLQFDILDTGPGMSDEQVKRLFQPFVQADASTTRKFGGTGLGLTISRRLARLLGGDLVIAETAEGAGTRFRIIVATGSLDGVELVDDPAAATVVAPDKAGWDAGADQQPLSDCHILLAEDGPDNQRLIVHVLRKAGARVTIAENGKLAVETAIAATHQRRSGDPPEAFDVVLMDMQMPIMDGYEATALLRQKDYTHPIIALTAHAMATDREKCIQAGCDDYATKPIDRRALIETIRKYARSTRSPAKTGAAAQDP